GGAVDVVIVRIAVAISINVARDAVAADPQSAQRLSEDGLAVPVGGAPGGRADSLGTDDEVAAIGEADPLNPVDAHAAHQHRSPRLHGGTVHADVALGVGPHPLTDHVDEAARLLDYVAGDRGVNLAAERIEHRR